MRQIKTVVKVAKNGNIIIPVKKGDVLSIEEEESAILIRFSKKTRKNLPSTLPFSIIFKIINRLTVASLVGGILLLLIVFLGNNLIQNVIDALDDFQPTASNIAIVTILGISLLLLSAIILKVVRLTKIVFLIIQNIIPKLVSLFVSFVINKRNSLCYFLIFFYRKILRFFHVSIRFSKRLTNITIQVLHTIIILFNIIFIIIPLFFGIGILFILTGIGLILLLLVMFKIIKLTKIVFLIGVISKIILFIINRWNFLCYFLISLYHKIFKFFEKIYHVFIGFSKHLINITIRVLYIIIIIPLLISIIFIIIPLSSFINILFILINVISKLVSFVINKWNFLCHFLISIPLYHKFFKIIYVVGLIGVILLLVIFLGNYLILSVSNTLRSIDFQQAILHIIIIAIFGIGLLLLIIILEAIKPIKRAFSIIWSVISKLVISGWNILCGFLISFYYKIKNFFKRTHHAFTKVNKRFIFLLLLLIILFIIFITEHQSKDKNARKIPPCEKDSGGNCSPVVSIRLSPPPSQPITTGKIPATKDLLSVIKDLPVIKYLQKTTRVQLSCEDEESPGGDCPPTPFKAPLTESEGEIKGEIKDGCVQVNRETGNACLIQIIPTYSWVFEKTDIKPSKENFSKLLQGSYMQKFFGTMTNVISVGVASQEARISEEKEIDRALNRAKELARLIEIETSSLSKPPKLCILNLGKHKTKLEEGTTEKDTKNQRKIIFIGINKGSQESKIESLVGECVQRCWDDQTLNQVVKPSEYSEYSEKFKLSNYKNYKCSDE